MRSGEEESPTLDTLFGCECFILNGKNHLGNFDEKTSEGSF